MVRIGREKVHYADEVDQIHDIIDPMEAEIAELERRLDALSRQD